ncbi:helix-turn-helix transcriptional regulator [Microbacterium jiangjiandongii]|uniref:helix-turn-helix transcriptional regulator n=1 Tax=Microbacterium jiangjiandongii TaxID=3049071 RepID=UPI00214AC7F2|nr:helix-turn-helix domain-containing protein [Microbacterium sp. zg.Y843]MCR2814465.1 helix-turn-helix domain-containing protein [Microbacterium sp. zg.Y843]
MSDEHDELLTVAEAARRLGRSESQLRLQVTKGNAPISAIVVGRRMFRAADVQRFIDEAFERAERDSGRRPSPPAVAPSD